MFLACQRCNVDQCHAAARFLDIIVLQLWVKLVQISSDIAQAAGIELALNGGSLRFCHGTKPGLMGRAKGSKQQCRDRSAAQPKGGDCLQRIEHPIAMHIASALPAAIE